MAYVTPETRASGYVVPHTVWNQDVVDNVVYLKTEADKLDDVNQLEPVRAIDTIYQNTSGKLLLVTITCSLDVTGGDAVVTIKCAASTPPTTVIARAYASGHNKQEAVTFIVPPGYYYRALAEGAGIEGIAYWVEWYIH